MTGSSSIKALAFLACVITAIAVVTPAEAGARAAGQSVMPPGGVYTCGWISRHNAAALAAGVTCDYVTFISETSGFTAGPQPADAPPPGGFYQGDVPTDGSRVGYDVYAWSPGEYTNSYEWYSNYPTTPAPGYYEYYVENTAGDIYLHGNRQGTGDSGPICGSSYAVRKWGGHNKSQHPGGINWTAFLWEQ